MPEIIPSVTFFACGSLQSYLVPVTGAYVISAAGAQGGAAESPGGKGAQVQGEFYLKRYDLLTILVGMQGQAGWHQSFSPQDTACGGGGGGGTFIWKTSPTVARPVWPLLVAGGGGGGGGETGGPGWVEQDPAENATPAIGAPQPGSAYVHRHFGGGGGAGWHGAGASGPGPIYCNGGTQWLGGTGIAYGQMRGGDGGYGGGGGGGFLGYAAGGGAGFVGGNGGGQLECQVNRVIRSGGGSSYNSGRNPINFTGRQTGHGHAIVSAVSTPIILRAPPGSVSERRVDLPKQAP